MKGEQEKGHEAGLLRSPKAVSQHVNMKPTMLLVGQPLIYFLFLYVKYLCKAKIKKPM